MHRVAQHHILLIVVACISIWVIGSASATTSPCSVTVSGQTFDLSALTKNVSDVYGTVWQPMIPITWNVCGGVSCKAINQTRTPSVCISSQSGHSALGYLDTMVITPMEQGGVNVTYRGPNCSPVTTMVVTILIACDHNAATPVVGELAETSSCDWSVTMRAKAACLSTTAATTTTATTTTGAAATTTTTTTGASNTATATTTTTGAPNTTTTSAATTTTTTTTASPATTTTTTAAPATTTTSGHGTTTTTTGGSTSGGGGGGDGDSGDMVWIVVVSVMAVVIAALLGVIGIMWWRQRRQTRMDHEFWREFSEY